MRRNSYAAGLVRAVLAGALALFLAATLHAQVPGQPMMQGPAGAPDAQNVGPPGGPPGGVTFQTFYDALAPEGTWIQTAQFGYVWQPGVNDPQWAPYTNGHWVYSDDGWTWVSDEPWGWATYHYGRWANLDGIGWCWVPGYTWGPAWVSWRYGDGYCGWAPLPPDSLVGVDYDGDADEGFHIGGDCDSYFGIGPEWYSFLPVYALGEENYRGYYVNRYHNYGIINHTTNVTNLNITRGAATQGNAFAGVSLGGPSVRQVDAQALTPVPRVNLAFTDRVGGGAVSGGSLALYAPLIGGATPGARPQATIREAGTVTINRGTDISHPMIVTSHVPALAPTPEQVEQAHTAQARTPEGARVATPDETVPSASTVPLTSMRPMYYYRAEEGAGSSYRGSSGSGGSQGYRPNYSAPRNYSSGAEGARSSPGRSGGGSYSGGGSHTGQGNSGR